MRKKEEIVIIIIIFLILVSVISIPSINYMIYNVEFERSDEVEEILLSTEIGDVVMLQSKLGFDYDYIHVFGPYVTKDMKEKVLGEPAFYYSTFSEYLFDYYLFDGAILHDSLQELYFVRDGEVVSIAVVERKHGDMTAFVDMEIQAASDLILEQDDDSGKVIRVEE